jgi:actin-related protein
MAEIMFEKFGVGRLQVGIQALLPLFAEVSFWGKAISLRVLKPLFFLIAVMV